MNTVPQDSGMCYASNNVRVRRSQVRSTDQNDKNTFFPEVLAYGVPAQTALSNPLQPHQKYYDHLSSEQAMKSQVLHTV